MIALGAAIVIHVFLGYALITGLALKAIKHIVEPIKSVNIKEDKPPPDEPPPPPPKQVEIPPFVPPPEVTIQNDSPPPPTISTQSFAPSPPPAPPAPRAEPAPPPAPPAPTGPTQPASAIGSSTTVSEDDYPPASLRAEEQGRTVITVSINTQGRVDNCSVTTSSGFPKLDDKSCQLATRRFRFKPALQNGQPVASSKVMPIKWQITSK